MNMSHDDQLARVLGAGIESFDIPEDQFLVAEATCKAACGFLRDYWADSESGGALYPQGSMRLGTVTALIHRRDEYDLDMVCRHDLDKSEISRADLKADVGEALKHFAKEYPELGLTLDDEGRRCWTFQHDTLPFHMDILPAIPNPKVEPNGIWVTDTEAAKWHPSAPIEYADWFLDIQYDEWKAGAFKIAEKRQMDIEALPRRFFKTTLQRTVQALKRHRDIFFTDDLGNRPSSIIITTLAAQSYEPRGGLFNVLHHVVEQMPTHVDYKFGKHVIANPVEPGENFADRWIGHPARARRFFEWIEAALRDFTAIANAQHTDDVLARTARALGPSPAAAAHHALSASPSLTRQYAVATAVPAGNDRFA
ncbi:hypothetical protein F4558_002880 [Micromonospora profundi]|uniref:nucleotidyltransferase domain-containing protein n=1 Tax=Micromonospora profundi TaxID=1420889 RepID=UPI001438975E|nr:nucleotidyltransferase [Micromonospora profundi]NJC13054.1 hypothetical protein [Micromonospora profundi]